MRDCFYGWYMKCQSDTQTLAVIPAVHRNKQQRTCSIQIITKENVWKAVFSGDLFRREKKNIFIGQSRFGKKGIRLSVHTPDLTVRGKLDFGTLSPLKYDIMGPFAFVPFMECCHNIRSMAHPVSGNMWINGKKYSFQNGSGYWEGDRGRSFPKKYAWTHCFFKDGSLMLSVADIPVAGKHFNGIIGVVLWQGKEYRLATYWGARAVRIGSGRLRIVQGDMELEACLLESDGKPLKAPENGNMERIIHESPACRAFYQFRKNHHTLFAFETEMASFEYEYPY